MSNWQQHRSNPAKPGAPRDPAPPPAAPNRTFSFTDFVTQVDANQVKTATVASNGHVTGRLANGDRYASQVPTAIPDTQLAAQLQDHKVQVTGTTGAGASALGVILNLLPLLLFVGFFVWMGRRGRALAGGITSVGRSKARVYDLDDRPTTRFGDVASERLGPIRQKRPPSGGYLASS
jgi:cell division protease FtsH